MDITQLLAFSVKNKASDLHLSAGLPPMIRVHGDVRRINVEPLEHKQVHEMVYDIMNDSQRKAYEETLECDFSFEIQGLARFRVNAFNQNRGAAKSRIKVDSGANRIHKGVGNTDSGGLYALFRTNLHPLITILKISSGAIVPDKTECVDAI